MWALKQALTLLAEGHFVDPIAHPDAFDALDTPEGRQRAGDWLEAIGYRLAQIEGGGSFFAAYQTVDVEGRKHARETMRNLRQKLQPVVQYLETVRIGQGRASTLLPGDDIALDELMAAVRSNVAFEQRLQELRDMHGARSNESAQDRLVRVLKALMDDGYLVEMSSAHKVYRITGKIEWFYQLLAFMNDNLPQLSDDGVVDSIEAQLPLEPAAGEQAGAGIQAE